MKHTSATVSLFVSCALFVPLLLAPAPLAAKSQATKSRAKHVAASAADQKCVEGCVKGGAAPVLVSEGKVLKIADASKVESFLGKKVVVKGELNGDTVTVESVEAAK